MNRQTHSILDNDVPFLPFRYDFFIEEIMDDDLGFHNVDVELANAEKLTPGLCFCLDARNICCMHQTNCES